MTILELAEIFETSIVTWIKNPFRITNEYNPIFLLEIVPNSLI